jgi:putative ABC transport system permease protein
MVVRGPRRSKPGPLDLVLAPRYAWIAFPATILTTMPLYEAIGMALRTIRTQKLKSFFSLLGVLIGVMFLIAVVSIIEGMNDYMETKFATAFVGYNTFQVRPRPASDLPTPEQQREWRRRPPLLDKEADYLRSWMTTPVRFAKECSAGLTMTWKGRTAKDISVTGSEEAYFGIKHYDFLTGRAFTGPEVRAAAPVVVLGALVADRLLAGVDPIGRVVRIMGIPHRVIGVTAPQGELFGQPLDKFAVVPYTGPLRRFLCQGRNLDLLNVQAEDPLQLEQAAVEAEGLMRRLRRLHPTAPGNFSVETAEGTLATWDQISRVLVVALPGLVAISLVVGGIVIMNIMLMAVAERTYEIGLRKALGARRRDVLAQFLVESVVLSTFGAVLGIGAGFGLAFLIRAVSPLPAGVAPWAIAAAVFLGIAVGVTAGFYPATRASRLDPIQALRHEL